MAIIRTSNYHHTGQAIAIPTNASPLVHLLITLDYESGEFNSNETKFN